MEPRPQLEKWAGQVAEADEDAAADMDVAKRLLKHGIEALDKIDKMAATIQEQRERLEGFTATLGVGGSTEALTKLARLERVADAAQNLCRVKGRYNTEIAMRRLVEACEYLPPNAAVSGRGAATPEAKDDGCNASA